MSQINGADGPAGFSPQNMIANSIAILEHGLPPLPARLSRHMAAPMAHWTAGDEAVVLFLHFRRHHRTWRPLALRAWNAWAVMATFTRRDGEWEADRRWHGSSFHDPFTDPVGQRAIGGQDLVYSSSSRGDGGTILDGIASPDVKYLALLQDGQEDRRPLDNHFGAWVIRTTKPGPFTVAAIDNNGTTVDRVQYPPPYARPVADI